MEIVQFSVVNMHHHFESIAGFTSPTGDSTLKGRVGLPRHTLCR